MRLKRLKQAGAFFERLSIPTIQQSRRTKNTAHDGGTGRHDVLVEHRGGRKTVALQREAVVVRDDVLALLIREPRVFGEERVVARWLVRSAAAAQGICRGQCRSDSRAASRAAPPWRRSRRRNRQPRVAYHGESTRRSGLPQFSICCILRFRCRRVLLLIVTSLPCLHHGPGSVRLRLRQDG